MKGLNLPTAAFFVAGLLAMATSQARDGSRVDQDSAAHLVPLQGCHELATEIRSAAIKEMKAILADNLELALARRVCPWGPVSYLPQDAMLSGAEFGAEPAANDSAGEYSTTHTQVAGVDEADFVKNDGAFIYILADKRFQIIDAWPPEQARAVASHDIEGEAKKLFVHQDRAVIYSSLGRLPRPAWRPWGLWYPGPSRDECTYGYNCDFTGDGRALKITVIDIADRTQPRLLREVVFSGSYLNSRRIDEAVHTIVHFPAPQFPDVRFWPRRLPVSRPCIGDPLPERVIRRMFARLERRNARIIYRTPIRDLLPQVKDTQHLADGSTTTDESLFSDCGNFYATQQKKGHSLLSVLSFEAGADTRIHTASLMGRPGAVYASPLALYIAARHTSRSIWPWGDFSQRFDEASTVHKFRLNNATPSADYVGSGAVKGRVLNQFSMDEYDGDLRIATTSGRVPNPNVHSTVSVLREELGRLTVVGTVDNIAPTEDIRSARFSGERGFIVTFKKTDPLFVLDLSEPEDPRVTGELKIPGFSTYMHMLDASHLLTIGYDADDQGSFAWFTGIMLQIFDVSDMSQPTLTFKEVIGTRGSSSDAATNHLAFNYFAPRDLLAIPMLICEGGQEGGSYGDRMTFNGLMVYRVTTDRGFSYLGGIAHADPSLEEGRRHCGNWWTGSSSKVKRSIFMDDYVYSIDEARIKATHLDRIGQEVASIDLN